MSKPNSATGGSPPYEPSADAVKELSSQIRTATSFYVHPNSTTAEKTKALKDLRGLSTKLARLATPTPQRFRDLVFGPSLNVAVRIAFAMDLFKQLPENSDSISLRELASKIGGEEDFVQRITRVLVAFDVISENEKSSSEGPSYAHTPFSSFMSLPMASVMFKHFFDSGLHAHITASPTFYAQRGFKSPDDPKNSPYTYAHGKKDLNFFDIIQTMPEREKAFNQTMSYSSHLGMKESVAAYPFDELKSNCDGVVLVDVGGGRGHVIDEIRKLHPDMKGKVVLQDLENVVNGDVVVGPEVIRQPYNFFEEVQPVKGTNYFFRRILHDWPDATCAPILRNLSPAMKGHPDSRLLICDVVMSETKTDPSSALFDIHMMSIGGKERTEKQWRALLAMEGFRIVKIYAEDLGAGGIIEAAWGGDGV